MIVGIISFPGSAGDGDAIAAIETGLGVSARRVDYRENALTGLDAIVLPAGASYGDALRPGAIAARTPIMAAVKDAAASGMPILGISNGCQVLTEAGLLPGAFLRNKSLKFQAGRAHIRIENTSTPWTNNLTPGQILHMPYATRDGAFYIQADEYAILAERNQIVARYCDSEGNDVEPEDDNGWWIAAVCSEAANVVGIMTNPERATSDLTGGTDGLMMLRSLLNLETTTK